MLSEGVVPAGTLARLRATYNSLPEQARAVADFIVASPDEMIHLSVRSLATRIGVSEATITRCCQAIGYSGLRELKLALAAEQVTPLHGSHAAVQPEDTVLTITEKVLRSDMQAIADTLVLLDQHALEQAVAALHTAPQVEFYGAGSSIPIVIDAYHRFLRIGVPVAAITDPYFQIIAASQVLPGAVAFGISHSGRSLETLNALRTARQAGATTILLTSHANAQVAEFADILLITADHETAYHRESAARRIVHLSIIDALCTAVSLLQPEQSREALQRSRRAMKNRMRP
ncbi:MAG: MurR/RpiR family transcriptional regulator [Oscillochloris sp.]|nr:MurR/RpiR family transcriptional regulator [Oscillochloris sp.]